MNFCGKVDTSHDVEKRNAMVAMTTRCHLCRRHEDAPTFLFHSFVNCRPVPLPVGWRVSELVLLCGPSRTTTFPPSFLRLATQSRDFIRYSPPFLSLGFMTRFNFHLLSSFDSKHRIWRRSSSLHFFFPPDSLGPIHDAL